MKPYKIIAIAVLILFACIGTASADSIADLSVADGDIQACLSGTVNLLELGFDEKQLRQRAPYYPMQLAVRITDPETQKMMYANQIQTDTDGTYSLKFIMDAEEDTYNLVLYTAYGKVYDGEIEYKDGTVAKFNEICTSGDSDALLNYVSNYNRYMKLDLSLFNRFTDDEKNVVLGAVMGKAPYAAKDKIRSAFSDEVFNVGLTAETLTDDDKNRMFDEYIASLSEEYADIGAFINENTLGAGIIALFNEGGYSSVKDDIYVLSLKVFLENGIENIFDMEALFEGNLFSIPENILKKYEETEQRTKFYTTLYAKRGEIISIDDFYKAVEESIPEPEEDDDDSSGGHSGGSGSGGRKNSYSGPSVPVIDTSKADENKLLGITEIFSDLDNCSWAHTAIYELYKIGAINGTDGKFMPDDSIKREEFAKIVFNAFSVIDNADTKITFADVGENDWYFTAVSALASNGVINGISETEFGIGRPITRQDAAAVISRILKVSDSNSDTVKFADDEDIADYAKVGVYALRKSGILSGYADGSFRPNSPITRAEAAQMICNILKLTKGGAAAYE